MCFPQTLGNDFMLMVEWSREKWDRLEFPFPASSQFSRERCCDRTANSGSYFATVSSFWGFSHQGRLSWEHVPLTQSSMPDRKRPPGGEDAEAVSLHVDVLPWAAAFPRLNYSHPPKDADCHMSHICDETRFDLTCRNLSLCLLWPQITCWEPSYCFFLHNFIQTSSFPFC